MGDQLSKRGDGNLKNSLLKDINNKLEINPDTPTTDSEYVTSEFKLSSIPRPILNPGIITRQSLYLKKQDETKKIKTCLPKEEKNEKFLTNEKDENIKPSNTFKKNVKIEQKLKIDDDKKEDINLFPKENIILSQKENSTPKEITNDNENNTNIKLTLNEKKRDFETETLCEKEIPTSNQIALHRFITENQGWIDRVCTPNVFASSYKKFQPLDNLDNLPYESTYIKQIENFGIKKLTNLESWSLVALNERLNTIMIGANRSGKTICYLFSFLHRIITDDLSYLPPGNSPHLLILVPCWNSGQKIYEICEKLINCSQFEIIQIYGDGRENEKYPELMNGCKILITSPPCFLRLFLTNKIINFNRLIGLVFEEGNKLFDRFQVEMEVIIKYCSHIKNRTSIQFIVCSEIWKNNLDVIFNKLNYERCLIISSPLEAAIFSGVQIKFKLVNQEDKVNTLLNILERNKSNRKTVIVCNNTLQLKEIAGIIELQLPYILKADETIFHPDLQDIYDNWKNDNNAILICTDAVIPSIGLRDAQCLIHYSLPPASRTQFSQRFAIFLDHLSPNFGQSKDLESHVLIDETVSIQIPELINLTRRLELDVHPQLESRSLNFRRQNSLNKKYREILCPDFKAFGQCWNERVCRYRHEILAELDKVAEGVPQSGKVSLHLLSVQNNCTLSARILKHESINGSENQKINKFDYINLSMKLSLYCNRPIKKEKAPSEGEVWVFKNQQNCPKRVKILKIDDYEAFVYFLDEASTQTIDIRHLIPLSEELAKFPAQAVQIFICNLLPTDLDESWHPRISLQVYNWLKITRETNYELVGKINLALGHSLWLDPIEVKKNLPTTKTYSIDLVLRNKLLSNNLAIINPNHIEKLRRYCLDAGLVIAELKSPTVKKTRDNAPWAYLSTDEWIEIHLINIKNPDFFFVRQIKFLDSLKQLNKQLQKQIIKRPKVFEEGAFIAVRANQNQTWQRGKILSILNKNEVEVLTVDEGEQFIVSIENIAQISDKFLDRLPCQIIEASLVGIESSIPGSWPQETISTFIKFGKFNESSFSLYARVCEKKTSQLTGGKHYRVVLMDKLNLDSLSINARLIAQDLAKLIESEKHFILDIKLTIPQQEDHDDLDSDETNVSLEKFELPKSTSEASCSIFKSSEKNKKQNIEKIFEIENYDEGFEFCIDHPAEFIKNAVKNSDENDLGIGLLQLAYLKKSLDNDLINTNLKALNENQTGSSKAILNSEASLEPAASIKDSNSQNYTKEIVISDKIEIKTAEIHEEVISEEEQILKELHELTYKDNLQIDDLPKSKSLTLQTTTSWEQDHQFIYLKIFITGVENYYISCDKDDFRFITPNPKNNYENYWIDLKLYGPVALYKHEKSGFYVSIKLLKIVYGYSWPRLLKNESKPCWIKAGTDLIENQSYISQLMDDLHVVNHLEPAVDNEYLTNVPIIEDEDDPNKSDYNSDSEDEEFLLKKLVTHFDPYDPFS